MCYLVIQAYINKVAVHICSEQGRPNQMCETWSVNNKTCLVRVTSLMDHNILPLTYYAKKQAAIINNGEKKKYSCNLKQPKLHLIFPFRFALGLNQTSEAYIVFRNRRFLVYFLFGSSRYAGNFTFVFDAGNDVPNTSWLSIGTGM